MRDDQQPTGLITVRNSSGTVLAARDNARMYHAILLLNHRLIADVPGITHLALGSGVGSGSLALPQAPVPHRTEIFDEINRVAITGIAFSDLQNTEGSTYTDGERSSRLLVSTVVQSNDCDALITEIALFGGVGGNLPGEGTVFAWSTFPAIDNRTGGSNPSAPENLNFEWILKFPLPSDKE